MNIGGIKVFIGMSNESLLNESNRIKTLMGLNEQGLSDFIKKVLGVFSKDESSEDKSNEIISPLCNTSNPWYVTSKFGTRTLDGKTHSHRAVDLRADYVDVVAPFSGVMDRASGFGKGNCGGMIIITNDEKKLSAKFCHMSQIDTSLIGKPVKMGQKIGVSGGSIKKDGSDKSKRGNSKDAHLHFELRKDGQLVDPERHINKGFCPKK